MRKLKFTMEVELEVSDGICDEVVPLCPARPPKEVPHG